MKKLTMLNNNRPSENWFRIQVFDKTGHTIEEFKKIATASTIKDNLIIVWKHGGFELSLDTETGLYSLDRNS